MRHLIRILLAASVVPAAMFVGCATEEIPPYGDPSKVVGGVGATAGSSSSSSSSGGVCMPDAGCAKSWANDVFPILETKAKCSNAECHAPGQAQPPVITPGDAKASLQVLLAHPFNEEPTEPYIVPCNPAASKMICNMRLDTGNNTNPFGPDCLPRMPKVSMLDAVDDLPLTVDELNTIAEWITCGAPDN